MVVVGATAPAEMLVAHARERDEVQVIPVAGPLEAVAAGADLVLEATPELPLGARIQVLDGLLGAVPAATPVTAVTRLHPIAALAGGRAATGRLVALNVVGAADRRPPRLLELTLPASAAPDAVDRAHACLSALGVPLVACGDLPGRIVDRLAAAALLEARRGTHRAGIAEPDLDAAFRARGCAGAPERVARDLALTDDVLAALSDGMGAPPRFAIPARPSAPRSGIDADAVVDQVQLAVLAEAYRLVGEGGSDPSDVDRAARLAMGWPVGPFELAGSWGLRRVVTRMAELARDAAADATTRDRFAVPPLLWTVATA